MSGFLVERRISDVHTRLVRVRQELAILDEQLEVVTADAEDARIRSLVSETPLATHDYGEVKRHADTLTRARSAMADEIASLEERQNELLADLGRTS